MKKDEIRLVMIDDQKLFLDLIEKSLEDDPLIEVIGMFQSGKELFQFLGLKKVDIVLLDVEIPAKLGDDGFQIAEKLKSTYPKIKIISISVNTQSHVIRRLIKTIGVNGFIDKNSASLKDLQSIIQIVHQGHFYIDQNLENKALRIFEMEQLTRREREVVELIISGLNNNQIAECLHLSVKTVDNHRQNIFLKLDCSKVTELAQKYFFFKYLQNDSSEFLPNFKREP